jgi:DNA-binding ferritin-like protein
MNSEVIAKLVQIQMQFRFMHWQTFSYAKHKAYGKIYEALVALVDEFAEVCMGKHGRPEYLGGLTLEIEDLSQMSLQEFVDDSVNFLLSFDEIYDTVLDTDLLNLRDEMVALINRGKYLFTLE